MKIRRAVWIGAFALVFLQNTQGGDFTNLDFELAKIPATPVGQWGDLQVDPALAFPGWTVGDFWTYSLYNNLTLGAPMAGLMGPDFPNGPMFPPLQGNYSVLLAFLAGPPPPTLSQTGLVPADTTSITFLAQEGRRDAILLVNDANIPLYPISNGRLAGDISAFAGTVATITFTTPGISRHPAFLYLDDVQFASSPFPALVCHPGMGQVTISWATNLNGYTLESSDSPTAASWIGITNTSVVIASRFSVTVDSGTQQKFFRLHLQRAVPEMIDIIQGWL